jgi:hypothetical protein
VWPVMVALALGGLLFWASAFIIGDRTEEQRQVGAAANFGAVRAPIIPVDAVPFSAVTPIQTRDLGRLVRISGVAESGVRVNSVWVRTSEGYRILVRFQPEPAPEALPRITPGSRVEFDGYLQNIAIAEFHQVVDSLGVRLPRSPPSRKFGDLPDSAFIRADAMYIKNYFVSVRPEGIQPRPPVDART